jgi:hypothetical protein
VSDDLRTGLLRGIGSRISRSIIYDNDLGISELLECRSNNFANGQSFIFCGDNDR